jgi:hypothetical protein
MNTSKLERQLIAAARAHAPTDAVPYAFEKRIMARIASASVPVFDAWADWSRALWRAAAPCVAVAILVGVWVAFQPEPAPASGDLSQELDNTLLAAVVQDGNNTW